MANQTPYIGSKISLISKLDIRYEGVLYTVDTQDSTIALSKVRSFGTEDRPTSNPVSARDDVYEYIIFKASDIKDLIVCETPKPNLGGLPYDPAIISVQRTVPTDDKTSPAGSRSGTPQSSGYTGNRAPGAGRGGSRGGSYSDDRGQGPRTYNRGGHQQNRTPRQPNGMLRPKGEKLKFDGDYDFEKANEQFVDMFKEKLKVEGDKSEEENGAMQQPEVAPADAEENGKFYDKKTSFFDNISCEALEKAEGKSGRPDWKKERETNQETFGQTSVRSFNTYRRGFNQRGRGRGGYNQGYGGFNQRGRGYQRGGGSKQFNRDVAA